MEEMIKKYRRGRRRKQKKRMKGLLLLLFIALVAVVGGCIYEISQLLNRTGEIDISREVTQGEIPLFLQTDIRWKNRTYGDGTMEKNGCGPTCLSMVYCGLTGDDRWNPYSLASKAEKDGYYVIGSGSAWSMMTELAEEIGLTAYEVGFDEGSIRAELQAGHPIICAMGPGDFTTAGHFIVLTGMDEDGKIRVNDPNSKKNSKKSWELDELMAQMKNLWGYRY